MYCIIKSITYNNVHNPRFDYLINQHTFVPIFLQWRTKVKVADDQCVLFFTGLNYGVCLNKICF